MSDDEYYEDEAPPARRSLRPAAPAATERRSLRPAGEGRAEPVAAADEEEAPRPKPSGGTSRLKVGRGWGASRRAIESTSSFAQNFKPVKEIQIVKFLEAEPYAAYARHWLERMIDGRKQLRTYLCLDSLGAPCPICDGLGDRPQAVSAFNVALIDDDGTVTRKSWDVGVKLLRQIQNAHEDSKLGPLTRPFFAVSKSGTGPTSSVALNPILRASLLTEDYGVVAPDEAELAALELYDESIIEIPKRSQLEEIVDELSDSGEYA